MERWRRDKTAVIATAVGVALPLAAGAVTWVSASKPTPLFYGFVVLSAALGASVALLAARQKRMARDRTIARSLHLTKPARDIDPYADLSIPQSPRERRNEDGLTPYIPRAPYDEQLKAALASCRFALLLAPRGWGSSRAAFMATRRTLPEAMLAVPADPAGLHTVLDLDPLWEPLGTVNQPFLLWLDRLERYLDDRALTVADLRRLLACPHVAVIATLHTERRAGAGEVIGFAEQSGGLVEVGERLTRADRRAGAEHYPEADFAGGIGAWFNAPAAVRHAYRDASAREAAGRRVVEAAVDWRRCGMSGAAPAATLQVLTRKLLEGGRLSDDAFAAALEWATREVSGSGVALLHEEPEGGFSAHALCVECDEGRHGASYRPIAATTWVQLSRDAEPEAAVSIARAAMRVLEGTEPQDLRVVLAACEAAATKAASAGIADAEYILGLLRHGSGDDEKAKEHWRRAWGQRHVDAANNLGAVLLHQAAALEGEEHERLLLEARRALLGATAKGHALATGNLARLLHKAGEIANAEGVYRMAIKRGDADAGAGLGQLLEKLDRVQEAEVVYRAAAENANTHARLRLAKLLARRGADEEAEKWLRLAADAGDDGAGVLLGRLLEKRGAHEEAESAYSRAAESGHVGALLQLATAAEQRGDQDNADALTARISEPLAGLMDDANALMAKASFDLGKFALEEGNLDDAERYFREAAVEGHLEAQFGIGHVLEQGGLTKEAQAAFQQAADAGHADARARLGALLENDGQPVEALSLYEAAANAGSAEGRYRLGLHREAEKRTVEAEELFRLAAPHHPQAAWELVRLIGDRATEADFQRADDWRVHEGTRLANQGRTEEAESCLRQAAEHEHPEAMFELSMLLQLQGNTEEAARLRGRAAVLGHRSAKLFEDLLDFKPGRSRPP